MNQSGLSVLFRIILFVASVGTAFFFLRKIRKSKVQIHDVVFWLLFAGVLILLSIFPEILSFFSGLLGIQSPANFLFLVIIFLQLVHQFSLTIRVSTLESKLNQLGRQYALDKIPADNSDEKGVIS